MTNFVYLLASVLGLVLLVYVIRSMFFIGRNVQRIEAMITQIGFTRVDQIFSPEIEISYEFRVNSKTYRGHDFLRIDEILGNESFLITNRRNFPVLNTSEKSIVGEEHIETYLLSRQSHVEVEFNVHDPVENRIIKSSGARPLFGNFSIDFPWLK